ncbi:hypothetical protein GIB67_019856 [Kingdonia uniflora]|uniref:Uncharacterized protein n=1 Tax=Kingdonia uniflora TaxID=39325 RepID=A0A7J7MKM4_9MAGN|nr:hypothetical protein GIB67_019856 [Kingdonia uniflora]
MGSTCSCVNAKDSSPLNKITNRALHRSAGYSPSWSFWWDNRKHMAGKTKNPADRYSHVRIRYAAFEVKSHEDADTEVISDGGSVFENLRRPAWQKTLVHEGIIENLTTHVSDLSTGSSFSTRVRDLTKVYGIADPSSSKLSFSMSESDNHSFFRSYPLPGELTPSRQARRSPGHQLLRGVFGRRIPGFIPGFKSPNNNSVSEGRQSFVLSTGSSDGWSMRIFLELVASSQSDRWSFDNETFSSSGECLENMTFENEKHDLACPLCISGEKQTLKISEKALRINSKISRNCVVDCDLEDDSVSYRKSSGSEGKCPKIGSSSSVRNVFAKPFLKYHFSLGSEKMITSMTVNESPVRRRVSGQDISRNQDGYRYYTMEFKGKIVGVKVSAIDTTGPGDAFVSGDLQEMVFEGTRDFDLQRLTWLLFERFSASVIGPEVVNVVFGVATAVKHIIQSISSSKGNNFCMAGHLDQFMEFTENIFASLYVYITFVDRVYGNSKLGGSEIVEYLKGLAYLLVKT